MFGGELVTIVKANECAITAKQARPTELAQALVMECWALKVTTDLSFKNSSLLLVFLARNICSVFTRCFSRRENSLPVWLVADSLILNWCWPMVQRTGGNVGRSARSELRGAIMDRSQVNMATKARNEDRYTDDLN